MRCLKYMICLVLYSNTLINVCAQTTSVSPRKATSLFDDLPIDDPGKRSVLLKGENAGDKIKKNIFIKTTLSTQKCVVGEPVLLTYHLYTNLQSTSEITKRPYLFSFTSHTMEVNNDSVIYKNADGKNYRVYKVMQFQILPFQPGKLSIDPIVISNRVQYEDEMHNSREYEGLISSKEQHIVVGALPDLGKPGTFSGAVGQFSITANVKLPECSAGQNNILSIIISGSGNFTNITIPSVAWPEGFESYPAKESLDIDYSNFPANGQKKYEVPFVANTPGRFVLPATAFIFFNPSAKTYQSVAGMPVALHVLPAAASGNSGTPAKHPAFSLSSYLLFLLIPFVVGLLIFFFRKRKIKADQRPELSENILPADVVTANKAAAGITQLDRMNHISDNKEYVNEFKNLLLQYLHSTTGSTLLNEEELIQQVLKTDPGLANDAQQLLSVCNFWIYAPAYITDDVRQSLAAGFRSMIMKNEKTLI